MGVLPEPTRAALEPVLAQGERVLQILDAVGCSLILTDLRLILVREGVAYRPRTGVQTWLLDRSLRVRTTPVRHGTGRLVIDRDVRSTSVFVAAELWPEVDALVGEIHRAVSLAD